MDTDMRLFTDSHNLGIFIEYGLQTRGFWIFLVAADA